MSQLPQICHVGGQVVFLGFGLPNKRWAQGTTSASRGARNMRVHKGVIRAIKKFCRVACEEHESNAMSMVTPACLTNLVFAGALRSIPGILRHVPPMVEKQLVYACCSCIGCLDCKHVWEGELMS